MNWSYVGAAIMVLGTIALGVAVFLHVRTKDSH
jgi:hypothetical protein